ncbi:MAG TPA: S1/P1 nuclease [Gammaproteobacteria bacterium]|jgi:hypothetical protein|nr:S1/P1 nuclease [Gammaproteobacteria bacterium]
MGHMVIANIAYQNLKPEVRDKVDSMVGSLNTEYPEMSTFLHLAYWPDAIRSQRIETFTHWHYIDLPYSIDGTKTNNDVIDTDNAVWAVQRIQVIVKNKNANPYDRARFLSFLTHIVGDLHQPLHTTTLFSAKHPNGDKGGNLFKIMYNGKLMNTHTLWDSGVGSFEGKNGRATDHAKELAVNIMQEYPVSGFGTQAQDLDPEHWAHEGFENSKKYVYSTPENEVPSSAYINNGKQVAEKQAALAGYRLANLLNSLLS